MHTLESSSNKIEQRYTHARLTTLAGCITIPPHYLKMYTPMFEHEFLSLIKTINRSDIPLPPPPPPNNNRFCDNIAMLAFPQEKNSHYTTH